MAWMVFRSHIAYSLFPKQILQMSNGAAGLSGIILSLFQSTIDLGGIVGCLPDVDTAVFTQQFPYQRDNFEFDLRDAL